ncbi:uncharacterized protein LOC115629091 [Scaptodrosophila lebanonensis]|uniref:Uncharacterized protein LOC115629091 n=1 Tax=Drosophila lebanonensis TaxID=7225 RepID=A0A6J2TYU4_DROLE|nr:uncharacterized protein LOC115629091 [Scaptodrosophila lebanonensis]
MANSFACSCVVECKAMQLVVDLLIICMLPTMLLARLKEPRHVAAHDGFHNIKHEPRWAHWNERVKAHHLRKERQNREGRTST